MNNQDLGKSFFNLMNETFDRYRGVMLEKVNGGWMCMGKFCRTLNECDWIIDGASKSLSNSIKSK